jgi:hypothetical protein
MKLQKNCVGGARRGEIDGKRQYKYGQREAGGQPVHQSRGWIKDPSFGIANLAHCSDSSNKLVCRISRARDARAAPTQFARFDE